MPVFLEGAGRWLLVIHALVGLGLLGASTHLAIGSVALLRGRAWATRLVATHSVLVPGLLAAAIALGLLMYPHYRVHVRGLVLDRSAPWASNLFDIKENFAALAVPFAACTFALGRLSSPTRTLPWLRAGCAVALWALLAFVAISGLLVTSVKGV